MKKMNMLMTAMLVTVSAMPQTNWTIDKVHSSVGFSVSHYVIAETIGRFREFDAKVTSHTEDFDSAMVEFTAKTASISTDDALRDAHLIISDLFFNAAKFPEMKFSGMLRKEEGKYILRGNLTIRDVTRFVSFSVSCGGQLKINEYHFETAGFKISGTINRLDFGLTWNEKFDGTGLIVGEKVEIDVRVQIERQL